MPVSVHMYKSIFKISTDLGSGGESVKKIETKTFVGSTAANTAKTELTMVGWFHGELASEFTKIPFLWSIYFLSLVAKSDSIFINEVSIGRRCAMTLNKFSRSEVKVQKKKTTYKNLCLELNSPIDLVGMPQVGQYSVTLNQPCKSRVKVEFKLHL